jgi:hypothetical protein
MNPNERTSTNAGVMGTPAPKMRRRLTSDGNGGMCIVTEPAPDGVKGPSDVR